MQDTSIRICRAGFAALTLVALVRQLTIHVALGFDLANFFSYYTVLSNLFAGCVLLLSTIPGAFSARSLETLRIISVVNMALVGLVFSTLLRDADLGAMLPWVNFVHHYLMPVVVVIDWIVTPPRMLIGPRELLICLTFPLAYLVYTLIRGSLVGWYPYPFLDAGLVGGSGVAIYVLGITVVFGAVGAALIALGNWRRPIS